MSVCVKQKALDYKGQMTEPEKMAPGNDDSGHQRGVPEEHKICEQVYLGIRPHPPHMTNVTIWNFIEN